MILVYSGSMFGGHALHLSAIEVTAALTGSSYVAPKAYIILITTVTPARCNLQQLTLTRCNSQQTSYTIAAVDQHTN